MTTQTKSLSMFPSLVRSLLSQALITVTHRDMGFRSGYTKGVESLFEEPKADESDHHKNNQQCCSQHHLPLHAPPFSSYPGLQRHPPIGTNHSPSAPQYILGSSFSSDWLTQDPLTSTNEDVSAPVTVSGKVARLRMVSGQVL